MTVKGLVECGGCEYCEEPSEENIEEDYFSEIEKEQKPRKCVKNA
jgi:hypothetical protein